MFWIFKQFILSSHFIHSIIWSKCEHPCTLLECNSILFGLSVEISRDVVAKLNC